MKKSPILILTILVGLTLVLSACVPGPRVTGSPGVTISGDNVYVAYRSYVYQLDVSSGSVNWHYPEEGSNQIVFYAKPLVTDDYVYVGDLGNNFHKINIETGDEEWIFSESEGFFIGQAAEKDGVIYAPSDDGNLYAIDEDGNLIWSFKTGHYLWSQPLVTEDAIYLGSMDHFVYGISLDGEELWSYEMKGAVVGSPILGEDGNTVFVGSIGDDFVALDITTGEQRWSFQAEDSLWGTPALANGLLYLADIGGNLYALDPENGEQSFQTEFEGSAVGGITVIDDAIAFATEQGVIKAVNFDGSAYWEANLTGEIFQEPAANDEYLVVGTINGDKIIYAFNLSGVQQWSTSFDN